MEYIKINSLWKRNAWYFDQEKKKSPDYQNGRQSFIVGDHAEPEFGNVKKWLVDEKVDGTNIRIFYSNHSTVPIEFGGRTANAQIPVHLLSHLSAKFQNEEAHALFQEVFKEANNVILFGEGYGPKIQACGGNYRRDAGFILFDIFIGGWWLKKEDVKEVAQKLNIETVPSIGVMTEEEVVEFVKSKPLSRCSLDPQMMEGVVCRSDPLMLFRNGRPLMWKLKCKEF